MELRDYQKECVDKLIKLNKGSKVVVKLATGAGKTIVAAGLVSNLNGRVLFVVPSKELREQTIDKFKSFCGDDLDIGSVQGRLDEVSNRIVVATRQSLTHSKSDRMDRMLSNGEFEYVVFDECHQAVGQIDKILKKLNNDIVCVGLTATPYNQDMNSVFTEIIYEKSIMDMINGNCLVEPRAILVQSSTSLDSVHTVAGEFNLGELEDTLNNDDRNDLIVKAYKKYASDRKHCLVFATGIEHSESIVKAFNSNGIKCYGVDSSNDATERESVIEGFKSGKFKVLVNVGILTTGFDHPALDCIIMARCTKSRILYEQILGRELRICDGKNDALLIDIVDVTSKHDIMSMSDVFGFDVQDGETPTDAKNRIAQQKEEDRLRKEEEKRKRDERIRKQQEMIAREINLFNTGFELAFRRDMLDWFYHDANTYAIMATPEIGFAIVRNDSNEFTLFKTTKNKSYTNAEIVDSSNSLKDLLEIADGYVMNYGTSFCKKNSKWKYDLATPKQLQYINVAMASRVKTKWDVNKYFHNKGLYFALRNFK